MEFDEHYQRDRAAKSAAEETESISRIENGAAGMGVFLKAHAGASYAKGLYRIHDVSQISRWTNIVGEAFPEFRNRILCFSTDWLGRQFALDYSRQANGQFLILMMEPGTGQALEIPRTFMEFHEQELVEYRNDALAEEFYEAWQRAGGRRPSLEECVGYKKPLFLGGSDTTDNLEVIDMDVYWTVSGELLCKTHGIPEGTRLGTIEITD